MNAATMEQIQDFPLPWPCQEPATDVGTVLMHLQLLFHILDKAVVHGMTATTVNAVYSLLSEVDNKLQPVEQFLQDLEYPELVADYRAARRRTILRYKVGGSL